MYRKNKEFYTQLSVATDIIIFLQEKEDYLNYKSFIDNIIDTRGRFGCGSEYHEKHHIVPRCMGGNDDDNNLIDLFAEEHFIVHKLLAQENPDNEKLTFAWWIMSTKSTATKDRYILTPEEYKEAKMALSRAQSKIKKERFKNKENHPMYGKKMSAESKLKMSNAKKGKPSSRKGTHLSEEQIKRIAERLKGRKWSVDQHKKMDGRYSNGKSTSCVPVYCPELDEYFWGLQEACEKYGFTKPNISKCLKGNRKHSGTHPITKEPLTWQYAEK